MNNKQGYMNEQCTMNNVQWSCKTLIELADYYNGMAFKPSDWKDNGTKIIRIEQLNNPMGKYDYYQGAFSDTNSIHNGDLIFSWSATLKVVIWQWGEGVLNQHLFKVIPSNDIDKYFLYYLLDYNMPKLGESSHGSTMKHIKRKELETYTVNIPINITEQKRIAAILSSADKVIDSTQRLIEKYKKMKQGMMEELLNEQCTMNNVQWRKVRLGEVGEIVTGLTYSPSNVCQEGVLVLRSSNIQDDNLCFEDNVYVNVESFNPVIENDILICVRNGSRALIGKTARITKEVEGCAFGAFMLVYRSSYNDFLYHFFKSDMFFSQVSRNIGATINSINGSDLKNMEVYMPSDLSEQCRIAKILSGIDAKIAAEEKVLEKYKEVKKGLMERMLDGE